MFRYFITLMLVAVFFQHGSAQISNDSTIFKLLPLKGIKGSDSIKYLMPSLKVDSKNFTEKIEKTIIPEFNDLKKKLFAKKDMFKLNKLSFNFRGNFIEDTLPAIPGSFKHQNARMAYDLGTNATLIGLPFSILLIGNNNGYKYSQNTQSPLYKFNFDPQKYAENIKAKIKTTLSPNAIANSTLQRINSIKQNYIQALNKDIDGINQALTQQYQTRLLLPLEINDISDKDINSLQTKLLGGNELDRYKASIEQIHNIQEKGNELTRDSSFIIATQNIKKYEALEKVYNKILYWRKSFQNNQIVKELSSQLPFEKGGLSSYLDNTENLKRTVKDHFSLTSLQQLFLSVTKLDMGQNALNSNGGSFSPQNLINNGLNTEIKKAKIGLGVTVGQNNNINNLLQGGLANQLSNEYTSLIGLKISSGKSSNSNQSVALSMFNFNNSTQLQNNGLPNQSNFIPFPQHKDAVITINQTFTIKGIHKLDIAVSKSFGAYVNNLTSDGLPVKTEAVNSIFSNKGQSNYAFTIDYKGIIWKSDINIYIKNVGLGYNNPGNYLLRKGEKQLGLGFGKTFFKRRINFKYNGDYRQQDFDPYKNFSFKTITNKSQLGYRFNRNNKIGIIYQRSDYISKSPVQGTTIGNNVRIAIDGNYKFKLKKNVVINSTSLSNQHYNFPFLAGGNIKSNAYLITHNSSILLKQNILAITVFGNKSDSRDYYFNTSYLSSEISYSYKIYEKINLTSGLGYYINYGWNKQLGISQQLSTSLNNKLSIDFQISYKKAIQASKPDFSNQFAFNSTIRYDF